MPPALTAYPSNPFDPVRVFQFYTTATGTLERETACTDPPLACPADIYPFVQRGSDLHLLARGDSSAVFQGLLEFSAIGTFIGVTTITPPAPVPDGPFVGNCPELMITEPAVDRLFGVWFSDSDMAGNFTTSLVELDPITFAQTEKWRNFAPLVGGLRPFVINSYAMSPSGDTFYYTVVGGDGSVLKLNMATGVTTVFTTAYGVGYAPQVSSAFVSVGRNGRVYIVWGGAVGVRVVVYEADGSVVLDLDLEATFTLACATPEPGGAAFWVIGQNIGSPFDWTINRYTLPLGVLDVTNPHIESADVTYFQFTIWDIPGLEVTGLEVTTGTCDPGPQTFTITGTAFPEDPVITLQGPEGETITFTIASQSETEIVLEDLDPPFRTGTYCVTVAAP